MTTPASGAISINDLRTELKTVGSLDLNATEVRRLGGNIVGAVSLSALYNKFAFTITAGTDGTNTGYFSGSFGSIAGSPTTFHGYNIMAAWLNNTGLFTFGLQGVNIDPSTQFSWIIVQGTKFTYNVNMNYNGNNGIGWTTWQFSGGPGAFSNGSNYNIMIQPAF